MGGGKEKEKKSKNNLQAKHKNNKCFSWVTAVRILSLTGSHSQPHLPRMTSNKVLISGPAVGAAQILIWSYACVLASNVQNCQKPGRPQSTGLQRAEHDQSNPAHIDTGWLFFFFSPCGSSAQVRVECEGGAADGLWGPWWCWVCRDMGCLCCGSYGPIRVFFWASVTDDQKASLDILSPYLCPFRHIEGPS